MYCVGKIYFDTLLQVACEKGGRGTLRGNGSIRSEPPEMDQYLMRTMLTKSL